MLGLVYGVLIDVYEVGVLIIGESGIGKSETALELIRRGHLLVADDAVEVQRVDEENLRGRAPQTIKHLLEMRGLGILDVTKIFGARAVREEKELHLLMELEEWQEGKYYERLGLDPLRETELEKAASSKSEGCFCMDAHRMKL